ncbi:MAG TPA: hypothetical protein V6C88_10350 [Chroococcidiopsis sp.]
MSYSPQVFRMFPAQPTAGLLAPAIQLLAQQMLADVTRIDSNPIDDYFLMLETSPVLGPALDVSVLLGLGMLGAYSNPNPDIGSWVQANFEQMAGSLNWSVSELLASDAIGYGCSEWSARDQESEWRLDRIIALDPKKYVFQGNLGEIRNLKYQGETGDILIPYDRVIHVVSRRWLSFGDPQGRARSKLAVAAWRAWKIVLTEALIAAQRQGTGLVVGYAPSEEKVPTGELDSEGNPIQISAPEALLNQLESSENQTVIATDVKNKIEILSQQTNGQIFLDLLRYFQQLQLISFLVPETILTATGVGDSNLNTGQRAVLELVIASSLDQIKEALLEGPIRALITWNFGEQESYGSFAVPEQSSVDRVALLDALSRAIASGVFSLEDLDVINKARETVGLAPQEKGQPIATSLPRGYWRAA